MRTIHLINDNWKFWKDGESSQIVNIPHCYNNVDGQDGSKMFRGSVTYEKEIVVSKEEMANAVYLEVGAAALSSKVYVNDTLCHDTKCGFSLFRVNITKYLVEGENTICIKVSNGVDNSIYPAMADFSFYGGIYRDVKIIVDEEVHFRETDKGLDGFFLSNIVSGMDGLMKADIYIDRETKTSQKVLCELEVYDKEKKMVVAKKRLDTSENHTLLEATIKNVHLWNGVEDPFLYDVSLRLYNDSGILCDERKIETGFRTVTYSSSQGLLLNGRSYQLKGVAKHQDFWGVGNAITEKEMQKDLELILETGANSVRCSHYQHCDKWYQMCDRAGLLVWAEIPVISSVPQKPEADENAFDQLDQLILQVRNHTCVYCYGVQNEVCMISKNSYTFDLVDRLSKKAKEMDAYRFSAQANEYTTEDDSLILQSTDIIGFNLYYGWYYGSMEDLPDRLDSIHKANPEKILMLTEYGVDTNPKFHSMTPKANDYSEEYQLAFSENALQAVEKRDFVAGSYVWNMFDFGSAGRDEGGEKGKNQKGLVTIDRLVKKDAFYLYKAHWSKTPFVYLAGRRFRNRCGEKVDITVISNVSKLTLKVNGVCVDTKTVVSAMTVFSNVSLQMGENEIEVISDGLADQMILNRQDTPDESYVYVQKETAQNAVNWFEGLDPDTMEKVEEKELSKDGFSFEDSICDIFEREEAKAVFVKYLSPIVDGPRFDPASLISVNALLGFVKALNIPDAILRACEQELNRIQK